VTESGVIDPSALDTLMETTEGDPEFLGEMIDVFLADAMELLAAMDGALAGGDAEALRRAAHSLKSNAATFGATRLTALARQIEELGKTAELAASPPFLATARAEFASVEDALRATRASL
jgi:HPt (histidine-containing phosphotransfer) domain-containing protein